MKTQMLRWQDGNGMGQVGSLVGVQFVFGATSLLRDAAARSGLRQRISDAKFASYMGHRLVLDQTMIPKTFVKLTS